LRNGSQPAQAEPLPHAAGRYDDFHFFRTYRMRM
jgi:hypothetical protein